MLQWVYIGEIQQIYMNRKGKHYPKDIEELENIFYEGNFSRKRKYMDSIQTDVISPYLEREILKFINPELSPKKIMERKSVKTFDYVIIDEKILLEVNSMNASVTTSECFDLSIDLSAKINEKILHIEEKSTLGHDDFIQVGAIFVDVYLCTFGKAMELARLIENVTESNFKNSRVDFLVFLPIGVSINRKSSYEKYPPVIFLKDVAKKKLAQKVFPNIRVVIVKNDMERPAEDEKERKYKKFT